MEVTSDPNIPLEVQGPTLRGSQARGRGPSPYVTALGTLDCGFPSLPPSLPCGPLHPVPGPTAPPICPGEGLPGAPPTAPSLPQGLTPVLGVGAAGAGSMGAYGKAALLSPAAGSACAGRTGSAPAGLRLCGCILSLLFKLVGTESQKLRFQSSAPGHSFIHSVTVIEFGCWEHSGEQGKTLSLPVSLLIGPPPPELQEPWGGESS